LEKGAGHIAGSSLPVGGESTHSVISAHRGLPSARMFTDLNLLKIGDVFYLHVLGETLAYEVDTILTVEPDNVDAVSKAFRKTGMACQVIGVVNNSHSLVITKGEEKTTLFNFGSEGITNI